jgi:multimeric flavodoxin WrbA
MKVIAFNGSPRKDWNTATLLQHALQGAASQGAETKLVHLYDYDYKGCTSCFSCKLKSGDSYGRCAINDGLRPLLGEAAGCAAILVGSPIYFGSITGMAKSFLERLMFPYLVYDANHSSLFRRKMPTGFIYTMGANQSRMQSSGYQQSFQLMEGILRRMFGASESLFVTDTYQFEDSTKYETSAFDVAGKKKRRQEVFPKDCKLAFEMGAKLAGQSDSNDMKG